MSMKMVLFLQDCCCMQETNATTQALFCHYMIFIESMQYLLLERIASFFCEFNMTVQTWFQYVLTWNSNYSM